MTVRVLDGALDCYRIGDPNGAYPILDATGSMMFPGRWNAATSPVIYASEHFSTALLEKLVHGSGRLPPNQHYVVITIPAGATSEDFDEMEHPGWDSATPGISQAYGDAWQKSGRSLILTVPSVVTRIERNVVINPRHPEFTTIRTSPPKPVFWDKRLFS